MSNEIPSEIPPTVEDLGPTERDFLCLATRKKLEEAVRNLWELSTTTEEGREELVSDIKSLESSVSKLKEKWLEKKKG